MNAPLRRGQCPTLAAPMQTGDGLLARLNPVTSGLSPKALIGLCEAALRHGNGIVEVTARGSLQIRGLTTRSAARLAAEVDALSIAVRTGVPVETGPLAGLDPDEIADPRPLAERIRAGIADGGLGDRLGPKVAVVVDGGGHSGMDAVAADVRLTAGRDGSGALWRLGVAGDAATAKQFGKCDEIKARDAVLEILKAIAALGREGRARDLSRQALKRILVESQRSTLPPGAISPLAGEMSGRTEGGNVGRCHSQKQRRNKILPLTDGRFAFPIALPFGHAPVDDLIGFVRKVETCGIAEISLAPRRTLILLCPSETSAKVAQTIAGNADFIVDADDPRANIAACPGAPACASGHIPARTMAAEIAATMPGGLDLHVSGCEKRCAKPGHKGLTLLGFSDGARLVLEGAGPAPLAHVARGEAVAAVGRVAGLVASSRKPGESEAQCLERIDKNRLAKVFAGEH